MDEYLPEFSQEVAAALTAAGHLELGRDVAESRVVRFTYDESGGAIYIYLAPARALYVDQSRVGGDKIAQTISIDHPAWVNLDVDNFGRPMGIEVLKAAPEMVARMRGGE